LSKEDEGEIAGFLKSQQKQRVFILAHGALEDYLPVGFKAKDLDKLIAFLAEPNFWVKIPVDRRSEIHSVLKTILAGPVEKAG
jgi:hypothetical protein